MGLFVFLAVLATGLGAVGTLLAVAVARSAAKAERRRMDTFYAWTMANGWWMREGDVPVSWRPRLWYLPEFRIRRLAETTVRGLRITAADCHYTAQSTDGQGHARSSDVSLSVFVARLPGRWPDIEVRDRHLGSRLLRALGRRSPIEIGHPLFDQRFSVETTDPRAAHALLSPGLIDAHLRGHAPQWSIHTGELMVTEPGRLDTTSIGPGVERLEWLAAMLGHRG